MRQPFRRSRTGRMLGLIPLLVAASLVATAPAMAEPVGAAPPAAAPGALSGQPGAGDGKIANELSASLTDKGSGDFYIDFSEHADLAGSASIKDWAAQGAAVVKALRTTADASQAEVRKQLDGAGVSYTSFWISNTILVRGGSQELAQVTAQQPDVVALRAPETFEIPEPTVGPDAQAVNTVEWGIDRIRADDVWSTFGVRGEGVVVASIDSGVDFRHPALVNQYRGNDGGVFNHDYNWFDPSRVCQQQAPCDNNNHGTHTMGTMVGDDGAQNHIGVAPRARWIAAKGCESNTCSDTALLASAQWMLAPTRIDGTGADPAQRPNIVNNSWGGAGGRDWFSDTIDAWRAAGIFPAFANGNAGPSCATAGSPGDDEQAFASASFDVNNVIAPSSSRGGAGSLIKPNLAAPGVDVRSSIPNGGYATFTGSSMASPHTAGAVALMWSAAPSLVGDVAATIALLNQSAVDTSDLTCGGTGANNNVWGEGRLDALGAVTLSPRAPIGTVTGRVTDAATGTPISGASIEVSGPFDRTGATGPDGSYTLAMPAGAYTVTASVFGRQQQSAAVTVVEGETAHQDLVVTAAPSGAVTGVVSSAIGPVANATVTFDGTPVPAATTGPDGSYSVAALPFGSYRVTTSGGGCFAAVTSGLMVDGDETLDVTLPQRSDDYGYSCRTESTQWHPADTPLALVGDDAAAAVALPFPFFFYGDRYSTAFVSTNGQLNFLAATNSLSNTAIPNVSNPNAAIYPLWDDLNVVAGTGQILTRTSGTAPNRSFVIEWRNASFYNLPTLLVDFQAQLNEDGSVVTRYHNLGPDPRERGSSATVGIENASGTVALQYSDNAAVLSDSESIRFSPPPTGTVSGTVTDANDGLPIADATVRALAGTSVAASTTAGADGTYVLQMKLGAYTVDAAAVNYPTSSAAVTIATDGQPVTQDFSLATPMAALSQPSVSFLGNTDQLRTARMTLANPSTSGATLTFSLTDGQSWLWTVPATGTVAPGGSLTLTVRTDATGIPAGVNTGAISITTNAGRTPSLQIPVTLVVPAYRQGVNVGGAAYLDTSGDPWGADQAWSPGGYGYLGAGWTNTTRRAVAGTANGPLDQSQREATSGYRFDNLPAGTYLVELDVAEFRPQLPPGRRVFDVALNGQPVLTGYDPVAAVGTLALDHREFTVTIGAGGAIALDFGALRGKLPPIVNAVRITQRPDLAGPGPVG